MAFSCIQFSKITFRILSLFFLFINFGFGQPISLKPELTDGKDFHAIQKQMNDFYQINPAAKGYKQWKRKEWFLEPRLYPSGKMENLTLKTWKEYDHFIQSNLNNRSTHGNWSFLGPTSNGIGLGRINSMAFHPTNAAIMYIGSASGGVWKTLNGGTTWANITPNIPLLAIADIKLSPSNENVIYVLTGDGDPLTNESVAHGHTEISSIGILRSPDAGATWYPTGFSLDHPSVIVPTKLLINPSDVNIQFVASAEGIYRTVDGWQSWELVWPSLIYDIEFKPGNPTIIYASGDNAIIKSTDGGLNWNFVSDTDFSFGSATRIELAVAPSNANYVYALIGNFTGFIGFFQSANDGNDNTWTSQNNSATSLGSFTDYCVALVVDPSDYTDVFGGMQWINRSLNQGVTWTSVVQNIVHADIHDVAYTNGALWVCCDGGLYKSLDEGDHWTDVTNGMAITEIYRVSGTPLNNNLYFVGCQDNGTMRRNGATTNFEVAYSGDGMTSMINYENSNIVYASLQTGTFVKSTTGGGSGSFLPLSIPGGPGNWITPAVMDPDNPDIIFVGKTSVYRSDNAGANWINLGIPAGLNLNCLAQGTSNRNRLYASSGANIFRTDNALIIPGPAAWINAGSSLPDLFITGITVDPQDASNVFIAMSGYDANSKVYQSTNGGESWINISGSLPNVPVNCITFDENGSAPDALYIGTDIGVFYRDSGLGNWIYYSNLFTPVNVSDLYINDGDNTIVAGTFGRGLWRSNKYDGCVNNITLSGITGAVGGLRYYSSANSILSNAIYKKDLGTEIHYSAGNYINLTTNFSAGAIGFFEGRIEPCPGIFTVPYMSPVISSSRFYANEEKILDDRPR